MFDSLDELRSILEPALRGERARWPDRDAPAFAEFLTTTRSHGIQPWLEHSLRRSRSLDSWPEALQTGLHRATLGSIAAAARLETSLPPLLDSFARAGCDALVLKGTDWARTLYRGAHLRPISDIDLLVARDALDVARGVLREAGFTRVNAVRGTVVSHQETWTPEGSGTPIDLHWRLLNPPMFSNLPGHAALSSRKRKIESLGSSAYGLSSEDSLLLACVHRSAHHPGESRLIWLVDIHLLVERLGEEGVKNVIATAVDHGVSALTADALRAAQGWFGTVLPDELEPAGESDEPSKIYLDPRTGAWIEFVADTRALRGTDRLRYFREVALPPADFMLEQSGSKNRLALPWLYTRRALRGIRRLMGK